MLAFTRLRFSTVGAFFYFMQSRPNCAAHPDDDEIGGDADFGGLWSAYPYFASQYILLNTVERGLFVVKYNKTD